MRTPDQINDVLLKALGIDGARARRVTITLEPCSYPLVVVELIGGEELADKTVLTALGASPMAPQIVQV